MNERAALFSIKSDRKDLAKHKFPPACQCISQAYISIKGISSEQPRLFFLKVQGFELVTADSLSCPYPAPFDFVATVQRRNLNVHKTVPR